MDDTTLPPLPGHPRHHEMDWTPEERATIAKFARAAIAADRAKGAVPFAWAVFDGEGGYDLYLYEGNESLQEDFLKRNPGPTYRDWVQSLYTHPAPAAEKGEGLSEHYDMIDRFLRNNLDDTDYAEYSASLDAIYLASAPAAPPAEEAEQAAMYRWLRDTNNDHNCRDSGHLEPLQVERIYFGRPENEWRLDDFAFAPTGQEFDAAIRAAMKREGAK